MSEPQPGPSAARVDDLLAMVKDLQRQINELQRRKLENVRISRGGIDITDDGHIRMLDDAGELVLYVGPDSGGAQIFDLRRQGGAPVMYTYSAGPAQYWALADLAENQVFADDALTGEGVARPWLSFAGVPSTAASIPNSTSASYIATWSSGFLLKQQPKVELEALLISNGGATGNARFVVDGTPTGSVMPIAAGSFVWQSLQTISLPGDYFTYLSIDLEVQRTNGVGSVGGVFKGTQRQS